MAAHSGATILPVNGSQMNPTHEYPFGRDDDPGGDIAIICLSEKHRSRVSKAFGIKARYIPGWNCALAGARFRKVIVFVPQTLSESEQVRFERWLHEDLPTKLRAGCLESIHLV